MSHSASFLDRLAGSEHAHNGAKTSHLDDLWNQTGVNYEDDFNDFIKSGRRHLLVPGQEGSRAGLVLLHSAVDVLHEGVKLLGVEGANDASNVGGLGGGEGVHDSRGVLVLKVQRNSNKQPHYHTFPD